MIKGLQHKDLTPGGLAAHGRCWPQSRALAALAHQTIPAPALLSRLLVAFAFAALLPRLALAQQPQWYFRATGPEPRAELAGIPADFDRADWMPVSFPHSFDKVQHQDNVYGWYACVLEVPEAFRGRDLLLDLGIVDDADATYFNGTKVGATGSFSDRNQSAWNRDRRYRVPEALVKAGDANVIAVQAKDFGGIGGLLGQPVVGVCLLPEWKGRFLAGDGEANELAAVDLDDADWAEIGLPDLEWDKRQRADRSYGWYRFRFAAPEGFADRDLLVDLGQLYDVGACYLNGELVEQMGRFPPETFLQTAGRVRLVLPGRLLKPTGNVLAVRVWNETGFGGLVGPPMIALAEQKLLGDQGTVVAWAEKMGTAEFDDRRAAQVLTLADFLVRSAAHAPTIAGLMARIVKTPAVSADLRHQASCRRVHALWLAGDVDQAWNEFAALDFARSVSYAAALAAAQSPQARGSAESGVLHLAADTVTRGDWDFRYGLQEAVLCAMTPPYDAGHGIGPGLGFELRTGSPDEVPRAWLGAPETTDKRALYFPTTGKRRYASWDDRGEIRPFDDNGPDLLLTVNVPAGPHLLALYLVDWDWHAGAHPRMQTIVALDERNQPLAVAATGKFGGGRYERFLVQGPRRLTLRIQKHRSPCVVVSGVFLDDILPLQPPPFDGTVTQMVAPLARRFEALATASRASLLSLAANDELPAFAKDCRLAIAKEPSPVLYWYLAETARLRADYAASQQMLIRCLDALKTTTPAEDQPAVFARLARDLTRRRYRPETVMAAFNAAASMDGKNAPVRFDEFVKKSRIAHVDRIRQRWLALHPLTTQSTP